jgi:hypothetical protein
VTFENVSAGSIVLGSSRMKTRTFPQGGPGFSRHVVCEEEEAMMHESPAPDSLRPSRKKFIMTLAGVAAVVGLVGGLLSMCSGQKSTPKSTVPSTQTSAPVPAPPRATEPRVTDSTGDTADDAPGTLRGRRIAEARRARLSRHAMTKPWGKKSRRAAFRKRGRPLPQAPAVAQVPRDKGGKLVKIDMVYPETPANDEFFVRDTVPIIPALQWPLDKEFYPEPPR